MIGTFNKCLAAIRRSGKQVRRYWKEKGSFRTVLAIIETLATPLLRRRKRLVYDISLTERREASEWGPGENLVIFGSENIGTIDSDLLATMEPEKHWEEFQSVRRGNLFFVVVCEKQCVYRCYIRVVEAAKNDRKAIFFGELEELPEIRNAAITKSFYNKNLYKQLRKGLHTRVVNEQLRYLQGLGYTRAVLYIMAGNELSIKGNTAAGFRLFRVLNDWIIFGKIVFQKISEKGSKRRRIFIQ
jgi:hypothetical protein